MDPAIQALIVLGVAIVLYVTEKLPLAVTAVGACTALAIMGTVEFGVAFSGFASDTVFLIAGMMVVGIAIFDTGVAAAIGRGMLAVTGRNERSVMLVSMLVIAVLSAFLSNSASTAVFIPIIMGITVSSAGRPLNARHLLMPLAFASSAGGMLSLVGSPPPLIVQEVLLGAELRPFGFFEFAWIGLPILLILLLYSQTFAYSVSRRIFATRGEAPATADYRAGEAGNAVPRRKLCASAILALCVALFATGVLPPHLVALLGALLVLVSGCVKVEQVYRRIDWNTIFLLAGSVGLAAALRVTGAGCLMADGALSLLGPAASPFLVAGLDFRAGHAPHASHVEHCGCSGARPGGPVHVPAAGDLAASGAHGAGHDLRRGLCNPGGDAPEHDGAHRRLPLHRLPASGRAVQPGGLRPPARPRSPHLVVLSRSWLALRGPAPWASPSLPVPVEHVAFFGRQEQRLMGTERDGPAPASSGPGTWMRGSCRLPA